MSGNYEQEYMPRLTFGSLSLSLSTLRWLMLLPVSKELWRHGLCVTRFTVSQSVRHVVVRRVYL